MVLPEPIHFHKMKFKIDIDLSKCSCNFFQVYWSNGAQVSVNRGSYTSSKF